MGLLAIYLIGSVFGGIDFQSIIRLKISGFLESIPIWLSGSWKAFLYWVILFVCFCQYFLKVVLESELMTFVHQVYQDLEGMCMCVYHTNSGLLHFLLLKCSFQELKIAFLYWVILFLLV
jgi:hypothetical protein